MPISPSVRRWFDLPQLLHTYKRRMPLILVNGLAEQPESWFANRSFLSQHFDVKVPEILVYDGDALHARIDAGEEISVEYLAGRLARFLDEYVQRPPYYLVGSSLGGQVILTMAARHPDKVSKLVLICPSGLHGSENLPVVEGVNAVTTRASFARSFTAASSPRRTLPRRSGTNSRTGSGNAG